MVFTLHSVSFPRESLVAESFLHHTAVQVFCSKHPHQMSGWSSCGIKVVGLAQAHFDSVAGSTSGSLEQADENRTMFIKATYNFGHKV